MEILVIGCSCCLGAECSNPDDAAWPAVLAKQTGHSVTNLSELGGSNDMIFRKAMETVAQRRYDLAIIVWSDMSRMEVFYHHQDDRDIRKKMNMPVDIGPGPVSINHTFSDLPWLKDYYAMHYDQQYVFQRWLCQAVALQEFFKSQGQRFLYTTAFEIESYLKQFPTLPLIKRLNKKCWIDWPHGNISTWARDLPRYPYGHVTEDGHQLIAQRMQEYL